MPNQIPDHPLFIADMITPVVDKYDEVLYTGVFLVAANVDQQFIPELFIPELGARHFRFQEDAGQAQNEINPGITAGMTGGAFLGTNIIEVDLQQAI